MRGDETRQDRFAIARALVVLLTGPLFSAAALLVASRWWVTTPVVFVTAMLVIAVLTCWLGVVGAVRVLRRARR